MTKIYPVALKCALEVGNSHIGLVDFKPELGCVFLCFILLIAFLREKS